MMSQDKLSKLAIVGGTSLILAMIGGCTAANTAPHAMSAEHHLDKAAEHDRHVKENDESEVTRLANTAAIPCFEAAPDWSAEPKVAGPCWIVFPDTTTKKNSEGANHHKLAEAHREAGQKLLDVEKKACKGMSEANITNSPFYHRDNILEVDRARDDASHQKVSVIFKPTEGLTAEWLQSSIDCHIARAAVLGHAESYMTYCPLMPKGVTATVTETDRGPRVTIHTDNEESAKAVAARIQSLMP